MRFSKLFFYVLLFLIPIQTRKVFFTANSFYYGFHSFYNTLYIYLTDVLIFGLIIAWLSPFLFSPSPPLKLRGGRGALFKDSIYLTLGIFWLILAISCIISRETMLSLWGLVKITEFMLLFIYIRENVSCETNNSWGGWGALFLASLSIQSIIGIFQYFTQGSMGLKLLGEEYLRPGMRDVAEFVSHGVASPWFYHFFPYLSPISDISVNLRAYGTFSHPNVFAGLLFMALMLNLLMLYRIGPFPASGGTPPKAVARETNNSPSPPLKLRGGRGALLILSLSLSLIITGLIVTFSRFAVILTGLAIFAWFFLIFIKLRKPHIEAMRSGTLHVKESQYRPGNLAIIIIIILIISALNYSLFHEQLRDRFLGVRTGKGESDVLESLGDRQLLANIAVKMIKEKPLLGVGLRNFVVRMQDFSDQKLMPYFYQPVHNIYLLIAAESGVVALVAFIILLFLIIKAGMKSPAPPELRYALLIIFFGFLAIGFVDHFPLTLQQGSLAFWLTAGLLSAKK